MDANCVYGPSATTYYAPNQNMPSPPALSPLPRSCGKPDPDPYCLNQLGYPKNHLVNPQNWPCNPTQPIHSPDPGP